MSELPNLLESEDSSVTRRRCNMSLTNYLFTVVIVLQLTNIIIMMGVGNYVSNFVNSEEIKEVSTVVSRVDDAIDTVDAVSVSVNNATETLQSTLSYFPQIMSFINGAKHCLNSLGVCHFN